MVSALELQFRGELIALLLPPSLGRLGATAGTESRNQALG